MAVPKGHCRRAEGRGPRAEVLGGSRAMLPRKILKFEVAGDAISCILGPKYWLKLLF